MKKTILLTAFLFILAVSNAQQVETEKKSLVLDGIVKMEQIKERQPLPYPTINESDIFKSMRVWRTLDLRERLNFPLYYPTELSEKRKSFAQTVVNALAKGEIKAYDTGDDEFTAELSLAEVLAKFDAADRTVTRRTLDDRDTTYTITGEINWSEVQELLIKEDWYFDKRHSRLYVRIIGICPVRVYTQELRTNTGDEETEGEMKKRQLFWVYYPDARKVLANTACFINDNDLEMFSFDDLFQNRRFSSYISAVSNPQGNRRVVSYTRTGKEAMLEARRLESELMNFESDLWEW